MKTKPLRILITDSHATTRLGIMQVLKKGFRGVVLGETADAAGMLRQLAARSWNLLILDIALLESDGLVALGEVKKKFPGVPVLVFSIYPERQFALRALKLGAAGYLAKHHPPEELSLAVRQILQDGTYLSPALSQHILGAAKSGKTILPHENLSAREFQVLRLIAAGKAGKAAGTELGLSHKTISTYRTRILRKLHLHTTSELIKYAVREGLA